MDVLYWNGVSLECNRRDHTGVMAARNQRAPTLSSRALAISDWASISGCSQLGDAPWRS
jgi:hypothetical protein